jgi:YHS domain-containing protein
MWVLAAAQDGDMVRVIIFLLLVYFVARAVWRLVYGIAEGISAPRDQPPPSAVPLAQDPVCGTYVVPSRALTSGSGNDLRFFCSERCRQAWAKR